MSNDTDCKNCQCFGLCVEHKLSWCQETQGEVEPLDNSNDPSICPECSIKAREEISTIKVGDAVFLPTRESYPPNGAHNREVYGKVNELNGHMALVRWTSGPGLRYCGVAGGWYSVGELLQIKEEVKTA